MSACVFSTPIDTRSSPWARLRSTPRAESTCEGIKAPRCAGRAARNADTSHVELQNKRLALEAAHAYIHDVGQELFAATRHANRRHHAFNGAQTRVQIVAHGTGARRISRLLSHSELNGRRSTCDAARVLRAAATPIFLTATRQIRHVGRFRSKIAARQRPSDRPLCARKTEAASTSQPFKSTGIFPSA